MKSTCFILFLALAWLALDARAQTPTINQAIPATPASTPAEPAGTPPLIAPPVTEKVVPLFSFDPEFPFLSVVTNLADQLGLNPVLAPELITNGAPVSLVTQPVGSARFENMTERQALDALLNQRGLVLATRPGSPVVFIAPKNGGYIPIEPEGGDLTKQPATPDDSVQIEAFFDPNKEVPLLTAIQMLGRLAKLNILVDPRVKTGGIRQVGTNIVELPPVGTNTVSLSTYGGVTPRQTLEAVLNNYGLALQTDPKTGFSQVTFKDPAAKEPVYTYVVPLRYSNTTNLMTLIQITFPTARVQSDARTAQLVLLSTQREYEAITNLVASLDTPTKQVLIEARFLETLQNPKSVKGIDWTDTLQAQRFTFANGALSGGSTKETTITTPGSSVTTTLPSGRTVTTTSGSDTRSVETSAKNTTLDSQIVSLTTAGGFAPNIGFLNAQGVNAVLSFLNTESDSRVLATPRAVTVDNQETRLEVTRAIPIFDASEGIGQAGTTVSSTRPNYTNVGTILVVTPRITGTNVAMKVRPEISKVEPQPSRKTINGKVSEADIFATSRIETSVLIPSGNTLVMGGLINDSTSKIYVKVPFLGDIPGLGWAFRHESKENSKANLIIFVTPTIIEEEDFQPHRTEFLNTKMPEHADLNVKPWNAGRPWSPRGSADKEINPENITSGK